MPLGNYAEMLMYTPFLSIYGVPDNIHEKLTYDAFFGENGCYIKADFDKKIQTLIEKAKHSVNNNMTGDDWSVSVNEVLDALRRGKNDELELNRWIEESNDGIFTILGDAGTGKSTFLHYLQWEKKNIQWHILDLKNAIPEIEIFGSSVTIPREYFKSLHGKVASAIILEIFNLLFVKKNNKVNLEESKKNLQELLCRYDLYIANEFPLELYDELYKSLLEVQNNSHNDIDYFRRCARIITKYFNETCFGKQRNRDTEAAALRCTLTHLLIVLRCLEEKRCKKLIVFDNIERFIGIDEIYNKELTDFLNDMRNYCDIYKSKYFITKTNTNLFAKNYQFIVSMRNTTVRNHVPAENGDFTRHSIDLSNWFSIGDIIHKKTGLV